MNGIKVESITGPDKDGNFKIILAEGSLEALQAMFPTSTPEEAFNHFWTLATNHFKVEGDQLKVIQVVEETSSEDA